jgi:hypothetical protein
MFNRQIVVRQSLGWALGWGLEARTANLIWHWGDNPASRIS